MEEGTRRDRLRRAALGAGAPLLGKMLGGCGRFIDASRDQPVPASVAGVLTVPLALVPELAKAGGFVVVHSPDVVDPPLLLIRPEAAAEYLALFAICPQPGCELAWAGEHGEGACPC